MLLLEILQDLGAMFQKLIPAFERLRRGIERYKRRQRIEQVRDCIKNKLESGELSVDKAEEVLSKLASESERPAFEDLGDCLPSIQETIQTFKRMKIEEKEHKARMQELSTEYNVRKRGLGGE